jgi:hypothetical protein
MSQHLYVKVKGIEGFYEISCCQMRSEFDCIPAIRHISYRVMTGMAQPSMMHIGVATGAGTTHKAQGVQNAPFYFRFEFHQKSLDPIRNKHNRSNRQFCEGIHRTAMLLRNGAKKGCSICLKCVYRVPVMGIGNVEFVGDLHTLQNVIDFLPGILTDVGGTGDIGGGFAWNIGRRGHGGLDVFKFNSTKTSNFMEEKLQEKFEVRGKKSERVDIYLYAYISN